MGASGTARSDVRAASSSSSGLPDASAVGRRLSRTWVALAAAAFGALTSWLALRGGPGISADSVAYTGTARVLAETGEWAFSPLWPPGYPFVLALVGTGPGLVALNVAAAAAHLALVHALSRAVLGGPVASAVATGLVATSLSVPLLFSMMWSEPLFVLCVDAVLLALARLQRDGWDPRWVTVLVAGANGAALLRYSSVALILCVGLVLVAGGAGRGTSSRIRAVLATLACAASVLAVAGANLVRGWGALGPRLESRFEPVEVIQQLASAASLHLSFGLSRSSLVGLVVLVAAGALLVAWSRAGGTALLRHPAAVVGTWTIVYLGFLVLSAVRTNIDPLGFRLLAPVAPAVVIVLVRAVGDLFRPRARRVAVASAAAYCAVGATFSLLWSFPDVPWVGHALRTEQPLPALAATLDRVAPTGTPVVSDAPWLVVLATGRDEVVGFPDAGPWPDDRPFWVYRTTLDHAAPGDVAVVFDQDRRVPVSWEPAGEDGDVRLYRVTAGEPGR